MHLLLVNRRVKNYSYGEQVVNTLELALLLLHLLPDAVYALRAPFHVKLKAGRLQLFLYRAYEAPYVSVAALLGGVKLLFYHVIGVVLKILEAQVLKLALQLIQTQLVSQRRVQIAGFLAHLRLRLNVLRVTYLAHQVHAVGNHYQYHAHVFGERQQQVAEVLALYHRVLLVKLLNLYQSVYYARNVVTELCLNFLGVGSRRARHGIKQDGYHAVAPQPYLVYGNLRRLQSGEYWVESEDVTLYGSAPQRLL